ncbi:MAG TPA: Kdo hydroxylase family protein [Gemmataceae bacterium]|nr:Kdo hydroxylase family protein [Gemmataceae bacterium]
MAQADVGAGLAEQLERGEVVHYPVCPFPLPQDDDHHFLLQQRLAHRAHKNISYNPHSGKVGGFLRQPDASHGTRLRELLADFSRTTTAWLAGVLPSYARGWRIDMVSYRPEEEATRKLRWKARNDLLHVDAFPSRPTQGYRILRVFANINPTEPRVWVTSEPFARLLDRYGEEAGLPTGSSSLARRVKNGVLGLFQPGGRRRSVYDEFMLRFHDFLKQNDRFQERCPKRYWNFQPGSAWMVLTDTASHAVLRGRFAIEHSYFIAPETLALPREAPAALLERACGLPVLQRAA